MKPLIRAVNITIDLPEILKIERECFGCGFSGAVFFHFAHSIGSLFRVCVDRDSVLGYCMMTESGIDTTAVWLISMAILPAFQKKGIGKALIDDLRNCVREKKRNLYLTVKEDNVNAIRFYEKYGFVHNYTSNSIYHDNIARKIYALKL